MMALGICAVVLGLMLFMEGVKNGLMPLCRKHRLPDAGA